ncbi:hypothetical protein [Bacillus suaedae]|uniref:DUF2178 domain-containing protein n=1 Tax=Halalkalibacter suaedae TaxID=2822140 RepID=A0A941APL7_9BACI|nr:hypothetical protein [Bacillus suaedae]MBP3950248.1 hypothetical protein [Bacillus suaedae]
MDALSVVYISILFISAILIVITVVSLPNVGAERKRMIKTKAKSFTFTIIITLLVIEASKDLYSVFWGNEPYVAKPPFALLSGAAFIYLSSLLFFKRKYGN